MLSRPLSVMTLRIALPLLATLLVALTPIAAAAGSLWTRSDFIVAKAGDTVSFDVSLYSGAEDTYRLEATGLPAGWTAKFYYGNVEIRSINVKGRETVTIRLNVATSPTAAPGDYSITFNAYSSGGDYLSLPLTVAIRPPERKASITPAYPSIQLEQGKSISCPVTISNEGACDEQLILSATTPQGWRGSFKAATGVSGLNIIYLPAKSTVSLVFEATPTQCPGLGEHLFILSAASTDGVVQASCSLKVNVVPRTQPALSCQLPRKVVQPGETAKFQVSLTNPTSIEQAFNVSVSGLRRGWSAKIKTSGGESVEVVSVGAGGTATLAVEVITPANASSAAYPIVLTARSAWLLENLTLWVTVEMPPAKVELKAVPPYLDAYGGSEAKFKIQVSNTGGLGELLHLAAQGLPPNYRVVFQDSAGRQITAIYVEAGQLKEFYVAVSAPRGEMGTRSFTVYASNAELQEKVDLTLNVIGLYEISLTNQNFYASTSVGDKAEYALYVKNTGNMEVSSVKVALRGSAPDGFTISVYPDSIQSLGINQEASFTITIQTAPNVNAGNYYIDFQVTSDQTAALPFTLRVEVFQPINWVLYAVIVLVIAVIPLSLVYRRFGRR